MLSNHKLRVSDDIKLALGYVSFFWVYCTLLLPSSHHLHVTLTPGRCNGQNPAVGLYYILNENAVNYSLCRAGHHFITQLLKAHDM